MYSVKILKKADTVHWDEIPKATLGCWKWEQGDCWPTMAQMVFVENDGFLCRMTCEQSEPWALRQDDGEVWLDSAMELFLSLDGKAYINIEANANGAFLACFGTSRFDRVNVREGIEVTASRSEKSWTVTIHLPLDVVCRCFPNLKMGSLRSGYAFSGNFYKMGEAPESGKCHYAMWNEVMTETPDFHRPEFFGDFVLL